MTELYKLAIIGLGYVGLPLAQLFLKKGHSVYGIDLDTNKLQKLTHRKSYLTDLSDADIIDMFNWKFNIGNSFDAVSDADAVILCVPTPIDAQTKPDLTFVRGAMTSAAPYLRAGQLIILESSTYPGTTEEELLPIIEERGLKVGQDISLAYSPERINPGQDVFRLQTIPKVVGGVTAKCTEFARQVYQAVFDHVVVVSSPKVAEMTKLLENCQRFVNISFMNELSMMCDQMGIDLWEAISAASTKPYGFTPYYPGPGIGGHCIPVDPLYLYWKAKQNNFEVEFIDLAHRINNKMPEFVVNKVKKSLPRPIEQSRILVVGVTYKKDVNDLRESVAPKIIQALIDAGAKVKFYDPYVKELTLDGLKMSSTPLNRRSVSGHDCTLILTDHTGIPYPSIVTHSPLVLDTRNATGHLKHLGNVILM
ncbi:MAG: UDP-N-acetyl-D-glucosamine dehydrogenase [Bacilli bacterium]|nr:UDP-N-acetyl-D-glucosamine dehydrogenase [Bacilli bacterium]